MSTLLYSHDFWKICLKFWILNLQCCCSGNRFPLGHFSEPRRIAIRHLKHCGIRQVVALKLMSSALNKMLSKYRTFRILVPVGSFVSISRNDHVTLKHRGISQILTISLTPCALKKIMSRYDLFRCSGYRLPWGQFSEQLLMVMRHFKYSTTHVKFP